MRRPTIHAAALFLGALLAAGAADTTAPTVVSVLPPPGPASALTNITVTFSEAVIGLQASDLLINDQPAQSLSGAGATWSFRFTEPLPSSVPVFFQIDHGITDTAGNRFDESSPGATWYYDHADSRPPVVRRLTPAAASTVRLLTAVEVEFSEPVRGVEATDLWVNGTPASSVSAAGETRYVFQFPQPASGLVNLQWASAHGIHDGSATSNAFAGGSWTCTLDPAIAPGDVVINELLADNLTGIRDEDGDRPDWIELHNRGVSAVNLTGWALTTDIGEPGQWILPAITIAPGAHLVIFASGKDRSVTGPGQTNHASFRLPASGGYLGLWSPEYPRLPVSEFSPSYPEQRADIAFGRNEAGAPVYLAQPTPGTSNAVASVVTGFVAPPVTSVASGFFNAPFNLALSTATPRARIHYSLDGSLPTTNHPLYLGPIAVAGSPDRAVTILRATAFRAGWAPSTVTTRTYLFPANVLTQPPNPAGFPAVWDSPCTTGLNCRDTIGDYEMDPQVITNTAAGYDVMALEGLTAIPSISIVTDVDLLFSPQTGVYVRREDFNQRPVNAEMVFPDGSEGFNVPAGLEIQGSTSPDDSGSDWKSKKVSLRLIFRGEFGATKLDYPVFPDSAVRRFDTLILDAGLNYVFSYNGGSSPDDQRKRAQYVRDQYMSDLQARLSGTAPHGRFVHVYLNGLYWGLYDLHERPDDSFAAEHFGGEPEDYDVLKHTSSTVVSGSRTSYTNLLGIARSGLVDNTVYETLQQHLDLPWFIDYMILNFWGGNNDWAHHNWYAIGRRAAEPGFRFLSWDAEHVLKSASINVTTTTNIGAPTELFQLLRTNAEFRLRFADRVQRHFFNGGVFYTDPAAPQWNPATPERNRPAAAYMVRIAEIDRAIVAESARWGDVGVSGTPRTNNPCTRNVEWLEELNALLGKVNTNGHTWNFFPTRSATVLNQFKGLKLYPSNAPPVFSRHGGVVPPGFALRLTNTAAGATAWFTTNGVDPRVYGASVPATEARSFTGTQPITVQHTMTVKARSLLGTNWSALNEALFTVQELGTLLRFTEIMYHPVDGDDFEFIEIRNVGSTAVAAGGFQLEGDVSYLFPPGAWIEPGAVVVLASSARFAARNPFVIVSGVFSGHLGNGGGRVSLHDAEGNIISAANYDDGNGWPREADGSGRSLEIIDASGNPDDPANWRASGATGGTPGIAPTPPPTPAIQLNEVMAENVTAVTNGASVPDWIELHNPGTNTVNLENWSLSDDGDPRKFVFPTNAFVPAGGFLVVWCDASTNSEPGLHSGLGLDRDGDQVFLYDVGTNRIDALSFGPQIADRSLARFDAGWQLGLATPGMTNVAATVGAVTNLVVNEWLANAVIGGDDWFELMNRSATEPLALQGLQFHLGNAWSRFPSLAFLAPAGYLQLIADERPGPCHLNFKLPAAGATLEIYDAAGNAITQVTYPSQAEGVSEGRWPDASANILRFPGFPTPGAPNALPDYAGLALSEILARNDGIVTNTDGRPPDWIELRNLSTNTLPLAGWSLAIGEADAARWYLPTGAVLAEGNPVLVWCDDQLPPSSGSSLTNLNTGQALRGEGEGVFLFDPFGRLVDAVRFGNQLENFSIGASNGVWQLLVYPTPGASNAAPATLGSSDNVRINEWQADEDWIELFNAAPLPVALDGLCLTDDPTITGISNAPLPALTFIAPSGFVLFQADGDLSSGPDHLPFRLAGSGGSIRLHGRNLALIDGVDYGPQSTGVSEGRLPDGAEAIVDFPATPTPGEDNYRPHPWIVINEALTHTDPPLEDAIELHNLSANAVDVGGWFLSNRRQDLRRYHIADASVLSGGGFRVVYEQEFNGTNASVPFALDSAHGETLWLSEATPGGTLTGYRARVSFGAAENGVAFGRVLTSVGADFAAMSQRSLGADSPQNLEAFRSGTGLTNPVPAIGPVFISEILYHPAASPPGTNDPTEFVELTSTALNPTPLFDPAQVTNRWRLTGGVEFTLPPAFWLSAGESVVVVDFDPSTNATRAAAFRAAYGIASGVRLLGPFAGSLGNDGETVELVKPDPPQGASDPEPGFVPWVLVDRVNYGDAAPWPPGADGGTEGATLSLHRRALGLYGNDPLAWLAGSPTPGSVNAQPTVPVPVITQPPSDRKVVWAGTTVLAVQASGDTLGYRWSRDGLPLSYGPNASLVLDDARDGDAGAYRVQVFNAAGTVISPPAQVRVFPPPRFTLQPASAAVVVGTPASFHASAEGEGELSLQWFHNGVPVVGATNTFLDFAATTGADAGSYVVTVTDDVATVSSVAATLTVLTPPLILSQPASRIVAMGSEVTLTVSASGATPMGYRWLRDGQGVSFLVDNPNLVLSSVQPSDAGVYSVMITNFLNVSGLTSSNARLTVVQAPIDRIAAPGETVVFSAAATGLAPISHQWQRDGIDLNGQIAPNLTLGPLQVADAGNYSVRVTDAGGLNAEFAARLFVFNPPRLSDPTWPTNGPFRMLLHGDLDQRYAVDVSTNLPAWTELGIWLATNQPLSITDASATNATPRFYRSRAVP